jgi:hypothetical protein
LEPGVSATLLGYRSNGHEESHDDRYPQIDPCGRDLFEQLLTHPSASALEDKVNPHTI